MKDFQIMTALITPFQTNGVIDYPALDKLIQQQIDQGVDGLIVCGTTAETECLSEHERFDVLRWIQYRTKGKVPIWFGCGTNNTQETLRLVSKASYYDIAGVLLVTPYYNKPSQEGLYMHFKTIANQTNIPIMLYQVYGRCGVQFEEETIIRLFEECDQIVALKHASDDYALIERLHRRFPNKQLYSGEDKTFYQGIGKGLSGLISVMSNAFLTQIKEDLIDLDEQKQSDLIRRAEISFLECSPSAIKYILHQKGICENALRLPLVPISKQAEHQIDAFLQTDKKCQNL